MMTPEETRAVITRLGVINHSLSVLRGEIDSHVGEPYETVYRRLDEAWDLIQEARKRLKHPAVIHD